MEWQAHGFDTIGVRQLHDLLRLRAEVFVVEQACAYADVDGRDPDAVHVLGVDRGELVAAARLLPPDAAGATAIGRVVVRADRRGGGLGRALMAAAEAEARRRFGATPLRLAAQQHLAGWYASMGYAPCGPGFDEDGIPHVPMWRGVSGRG